MPSYSISAQLASTRPVQKYGGIRLSVDVLRDIAERLNTDSIPMFFDHSAVDVVQTDNIQASVVEKDNEHVLMITFDIDEDLWRSVQDRFDAVGVLGGFSFAFGGPQIDAPVDKPVDFKLAADAAAFDDKDREEAHRVLSQVGAVETERYYQFSIQEIVKVVLELSPQIALGIGVNLVSSAIFETWRVFAPSGRRNHDVVLASHHGERRADGVRRGRELRLCGCSLTPTCTSTATGLRRLCSLALARARCARVVCVGMTESPSDFDAWAPVLGARQGVRLALGAHPLVADRLDQDELDRFTVLAPRAAYVGEVGLDGSREGRATMAAQRRVFEHVLNVTGQGRCVLSVHSRGAEAEVIDRLAQAGATAVLHWYSGPLKAVDHALDAGMYFSVNAAMIGTQSGVRLLRAVPHDRVVTESDGPFASIARRVAEPADIPELVTRIAGAWGRDPDETADRLWENMSRLAAGGARAAAQENLFIEAHG